MGDDLSEDGRGRGRVVWHLDRYREHRRRLNLGGRGGRFCRRSGFAHYMKANEASDAKAEAGDDGDESNLPGGEDIIIITIDLLCGLGRRLGRRLKCRRVWIEDVDRARVAKVIGGAGVVVVSGPDHDGIAGDGHGAAEGVARRGVGGRQLDHLAIRGATVGRAEDVDGFPGGEDAVGPNHDGAAGDRH